MTIKLEKILNPWVLLSINLLIIIATELNGSIFMEKGIIHLIAIIFVILAISRIFIHYDAYDRYLRPLIIGGSISLVILSLSHLIEFLSYIIFKTYGDAMFINVVNFYIISMLMVTLGAEYFLYVLKKKTPIMLGVLTAGIITFLFLTLLIFFKKISISLEPDEITIYIYGVIILITLFLSLRHLYEIKNKVSIMVDFINYFIASFVLITISALQYIFYDVLQKAGVPMVQIIYISHFLFYGALSFMFLAFARLANLEGMYKEIKK